MTTDKEIQIRKLIENWALAVRNKDIEKILFFISYENSKIAFCNWFLDLTNKFRP